MSIFLIQQVFPHGVYIVIQSNETASFLPVKQNYYDAIMPPVGHLVSQHKAFLENYSNYF